MDTSDVPQPAPRTRRAPRRPRPRRLRLLVVAVVAVAGIAGAAVVGVTGGPTQPPDDEATLAGSAGADEAEDEAAREAAMAEAERIAAEQAERTAALQEARRAAEAAAAEAAEEERRAEEEAAEAERRAREEAERAEQEAEEQRMELLDAQERLVELGYLVGAADGAHGQQTTSALMAFQAVNGLSVDGTLGPATMEALEAPPRQPQLRGGPATRIEVDMDRQVLHLVEGDQRVTTMKVSTGRGGSFESAQGETLYAETPVGTFTIDRRIQGEHKSSYGLGSMWDPMYFHGPWAIHGSPNVPAGPASSGCVRVALADGTWLFNRVPNGTPVVLYGGTHVFTP